MSRYLKDIETSCKYFDSINSIIKEVQDDIKSYKDCDEDTLFFLKTIIDNLDYTHDNVESARSINNDLRTACSEIAEIKNERIQELEELLNK